MCGGNEHPWGPPEPSRWGFCEQDWPCCGVLVVWLVGRARPAPVLSSGDPSTAADTRSSPFGASRGWAAVSMLGGHRRRSHTQPLPPAAFLAGSGPPNTPRV